MSVLTRERRTVEPVVLAPAGRVARVNLLPPEIAQAVRVRRIQAGLGAGLVCTAGLVVALHLQASGTVDDVRDELDAQTTRSAALQAETAGYGDVEQVYARTAAARQVLHQAMGQEVRYSTLLDELSLSMPDKVWLTEVTVTQPAGAVPLGTVTFTGSGTSHDDVAAWLDALGRHEELADAAFSSSTASSADGRRTVVFTSTATLSPAALSRRHVLEGG